MKILPVTLDDAEELLAVYAPYVTKTAVSGKVWGVEKESIVNSQ